MNVKLLRQLQYEPINRLWDAEDIFLSSWSVIEDHIDQIETDNSTVLSLYKATSPSRDLPAE